MKRTLTALAVLLASPSPAAAADPPGHDPTIVRQGGHVYTISSGEGDLTRRFLPIRRSTDLVHWEPAGKVFEVPPAWIVRELGILPTDFWAPDVSLVNGRYHVYYAASQAWTNNSVIGLATNATLDPADPDYRWVDEGMVVRSVPNVDPINAIDPELVQDEAGQPWLAYGSFWTGVKLRRLDPATGKPADDVVHSIAARPPPSAIEAPAFLHRDGFYYLFASFGYCCRGVDSDYQVVVGRSKQLTGPYVDRAGVPMTAGGGTPVLTGYDRYAGPGHNDLLRDGGEDFLVHHYYDRAAAGAPRVSVRPLEWADGWPAVGAPLAETHPQGYGTVRWNADGATSWQSVAARAMMRP